MKSHYFLALPLSTETRSGIEKWQHAMSHDLPFKSWVHPLDLHITLAFLGYITNEQRKQLIEAVHEVCKPYKAFSLTVNDIGLFGSPHSPRILWAGVKKEEAHYRLQADIAAACKRLGIQMDRRPYSPHITIARKWVGANNFILKELQPLQFGPGDSATFPVKEVVLFQTHLTRTPKYEQIETFLLKNGG